MAQRSKKKEGNWYTETFRQYRTSEFYYHLPKELIAQDPPKMRGESRLMVVNRATEKIKIHPRFDAIVDYLEEGDLLILNNTKVFPARLTGYKMSTGAKIQLLVLRELIPENHVWDTLAYPPRKVRVGNKLILGKPDVDHFLVATVISNTENKGKIVKFMFDGTTEELLDIMRKIGDVPLPPYIQREPNRRDGEMYQTIFAEKEGSVAAPTAGLHFSEIIMKKLKLKGVNVAFITLHIGYGSFNLIETEDVSRHRMEAEFFEIPEETAEAYNRAKEMGKKVVAVGTSVLRALESAPSVNGKIRPYTGWTNLFVHPPYKFSTADALITNFHLPKSPPIVMTWTFGGIELMKKAYEMAIKEKMRFLSYGDAMLIL